MSYIAYPAPVMPYHLDGTVVKWISPTTGVLDTLSAANMLELNDEDYTNVAVTSNQTAKLTFFFPELVDIVAGFFIALNNYYSTPLEPSSIAWSPDTTNGIDGTWTTLADAVNAATENLDSWRIGFKTMTGVSGAKAIRIGWTPTGLTPRISGIHIAHLYGQKHSGETADDILFLDAEDSDSEFGLPLDFADIPTGTSLQHQIKLQNSSAGLTASTIVITVVDPDDQIRIGVSNTGPWLTTQTIASLAPGAKSSIYYIKCEAPAAPTPLGPNRAPIKAVVGSWA